MINIAENSLKHINENSFSLLYEISYLFQDLRREIVRLRVAGDCKTQGGRAQRDGGIRRLIRQTFWAASKQGNQTTGTQQLVGNDIIYIQLTTLQMVPKLDLHQLSIEILIMKMSWKLDVKEEHLKMILRLDLITSWFVNVWI